MVKARKYVVKKKFEGVPQCSDMEIVEMELPPVKNGEILVKTEFISVDPYQRGYNGNFPYNTFPYDQFGYLAGSVQDSKDPRYPIGSKVVAFNGWCDYCVINTDQGVEGVYKLPDLKGLSPSLGVGAIGMPGATAYFGFLEVCKPKAGETVVVTGAAGAVGSIVGQIAKIKGCKVIGFAGSDDKCKWLEDELSFDKVINYKSTDVAKALKEAAPNGVDCYFDNVGGELSSTIIYQMNDFGRVGVCGSISTYNDISKPKVTIIQPAVVSKQLIIEGLNVSRWTKRWPEAFAEIIKWIRSGQLKCREHVTEGFENTFDAFIGMLQGENFGKAVVKVQVY